MKSDKYTRDIEDDVITSDEEPENLDDTIDIDDRFGGEDDDFRGHGRGGRGGRGGPRGRDRGRRPKHRGGRGRMGRGDVRSALLITLLDGSGHGYELIKNLEERTEGRWKPSPGSVYPQLQLLSDEGFVTSTESDGRRTYELTDEGRTEAETIFETRGFPWKVLEERGGQADLAKAGRDLHLATKQVALTASPEVAAKATEILIKARRDLYQLLADA